MFIVKDTFGTKCVLDILHRVSITRSYVYVIRNSSACFSRLSKTILHISLFVQVVKQSSINAFKTADWFIGSFLASVHFTASSVSFSHVFGFILIVPPAISILQLI